MPAIAAVANVLIMELTPSLQCQRFEAASHKPEGNLRCSALIITNPTYPVAAREVAGIKEDHTSTFKN